MQKDEEVGKVAQATPIVICAYVRMGARWLLIPYFPLLTLINAWHGSESTGAFLGYDHRGVK